MRGGSRSLISGWPSFSRVQKARKTPGRWVWIPIPLPSTPATPADFDPNQAPWVGLLGSLPILRSVLIAFVIWCVLIRRRVLDAHSGHGLVLASFGYFARSLGRFTSHVVWYETSGTVLLYVGDAGVICGLMMLIWEGWKGRSPSGGWTPRGRRRYNSPRAPR